MNDRKIRRKLSIVAGCALFYNHVCAQTLTAVATVAPGITGTTISATDVFARGFWNSGDSGGGYFFKTGASCENRGHATSNDTKTLTNVMGVTVIAGMAIIGLPDIPANTYVVAVSGTTITLSNATTGTPGTISVAVYGNDACEMVPSPVSCCRRWLDGRLSARLSRSQPFWG